jgi:radical SAM protein with 4Fe4S-binding SPASM domain
MTTDQQHRRILYELAAGVYLVPGATRGAICDTNTGNVYSLNAAATRALLGEQDDPAFCAALHAQGLLGESRPRPSSPHPPAFHLEFAWFEILTNDCNERCLHCYADSMPRTYRKRLAMAGAAPEMTEAAPEPAPAVLSAARWTALVTEAYDLGCRHCQFIGGEPFLWRGEHGETVLDLAAHARALGYEFVEIFTNATLITERNIAEIKRLGLHIAVSLYSDDAVVHETITRLPGSYKKTVGALLLLKEWEVPTRVETVLMRPNQATVESTNKFLADRGFSHRSPDVLRPKGRGDNLALQPDPAVLAMYGLILGPEGFSAPPEFFQRSVEGHNCLAGKVTITDNGNVLPCIFSRGQVVGNVERAGSLRQVLEGRIAAIWRTTKDDVLVCRDCEYRYVCFDCRPISEGAACGKGDYTTAPYPRCTYDPFTGVWGGGTWTLDEAGAPVYDETLRPQIERARAAGQPGALARGH